MRRRGFTLMEILIVVLLVSFGFLALVTVYMHNVRHSTMSRARLLATLVGENLLAEIRDHPYGTARPAAWGNEHGPALESFQVVVQGRPVSTTFEKVVKIAAEGNGSFFDRSRPEAVDTVEVSVRWREGTQDASAGVDKQIRWTFDVRREPDLVVPTQ